MNIITGKGYFGSWHGIGRTQSEITQLSLKNIRSVVPFRLEIGIGDAATELAICGASFGKLDDWTAPPFRSPTNTRVAIRIEADGSEFQADLHWE